MWESSSRTLRVKSILCASGTQRTLFPGNHSQNIIPRWKSEEKLFLSRQVLWQDTAQTPQSDNRRMAAHLQSITAAHFPASGTWRDIWHTHLPSRKQPGVPCLRATEPEVSKNLKQSNHHNNCWLMNMGTRQQTKKWFVTVSKGSPRDAVSASHPAQPWLCAEHQNSRPDHSGVLMEKFMRVSEGVKSMEYDCDLIK